MIPSVSSSGVKRNWLNLHEERRTITVLVLDIFALDILQVLLLYQMSPEENFGMTRRFIRARKSSRGLMETEGKKSFREPTRKVIL